MDFIKYAWEKFEPEVLKLRKQGYFSIDPDWWRSRHSDLLNYSGNMNEEKWRDAHSRDLAFAQIWERYKQYMTARKGEQLKLFA